MDQTAYFALHGAALGYVSVGILPKYLRSRPSGYWLILLLTFLAFFFVNLRNIITLGRYEIWEAIFRAALIGAIPIIGGYLFVYFTKDSIKK